MRHRSEETAWWLSPLTKSLSSAPGPCPPFCRRGASFQICKIKGQRGPSKACQDSFVHLLLKPPCLTGLQSIPSQGDFFKSLLQTPFFHLVSRWRWTSGQLEGLFPTRLVAVVAGPSIHYTGTVSVLCVDGNCIDCDSPTPLCEQSKHPSR